VADDFFYGPAVVLLESDASDAPLNLNALVPLLEARGCLVRRCCRSVRTLPHLLRSLAYADVLLGDASAAMTFALYAPQQTVLFELSARVSDDFIAVRNYCVCCRVSSTVVR
jgi:hypothetical protein